MSGSAKIRETATAAVPIWHEVECGGYAADLPLWTELASATSGPILELGCGGGRVALHLAEQGHEVVGIDTERSLVDHVNARARDAGVSAQALAADVTRFALGRRFPLVIAPMQLMQVIGDAGQRRAALERSAAHLRRDGTFAAAVVDARQLDPANATVGDPAAAPLPDVRERDGWVFSSLPLGVRGDGDRLAIHRLRQVVSPDGALSAEVDITELHSLAPGRLETEAAEAGLRAARRLEVEPTHWHVGSTVCLFEVRR